MTKKKRLTDSELLGVVDHLAKDASEYEATVLSLERADLLKHYRGELPEKPKRGVSSYVSLDVYDTIEGLKAQLLDTFSKGRGMVQFRPRQLQDAEICRQRTQYANYAIFEAQPDFDVDPLDTWIFTALYSRTGIAKVWWESTTETRVTEVQLTADQYVAAISDPEWTIRRDTAEFDEETGLYTVEIEEEVERGQLRWAALPPEEVRFSPWARSLDDADYLAHVTEATLSELRQGGLDEDILDDVKEKGERVHVTNDHDIDEAVRVSDVAGSSRTEDGGAQEVTQKYRIHEAYVRIDPDGRGVAPLHRVVRTGSVVLEVTQVDEHPFVAFTPIPIAHRLLGHNFAGTVLYTQKTKTALIRGVVDHTVVTNTPRWQVVNGTVEDARELLDNRAGGIVNVTRPDGIVPLPQNPLNPYVTQTLGLLDYRKEQDTGVSMLSTGLNSDAISKQNSRGLVQDMVQLGQVRQRAIARRLGRALSALFVKAVNLINRYEDPEKAAAIVGAWDEVDPEAWGDRQDCVVELHLGFGEQERMAAELLAFDQIMLADPGKGPLYSLNERKVVMEEYLKRKGFGHMVPAMLQQQPQQPQPNPAEVAQLQLLQAEAAAKQAEAQAKMAQAQLDAARLELEQEKIRLQREKLQRDFDLSADELDLKVEAERHSQKIAEEELRIAEKTEDKRAIVSPN